MVSAILAPGQLVPSLHLEELSWWEVKKKKKEIISWWRESKEGPKGLGEEFNPQSTPPRYQGHTSFNKTKL